MKLPLLFLLLLIPIVASQGINFFSEEYSAGETGQLKINLDVRSIQDLKNSQVEILDPDGNILILDVNLIKVNNSFYLAYFNIPLGLKYGVYTLLINDVVYREDEILKTRNYVKDFIIKEKSYELIGIQPGALVYFLGEQTYRAIRVTNFEDYALLIILNKTNNVVPSVNILQIPGKSSKVFYIRIIPENIKESGLIFLNFGRYKIPLYLSITSDVKQEEKEIVEGVDDEITTIVGTDNETKEAVVCIPEWQCSIWSECNSIEKIQTRNCLDINNCNKLCYSLDCIEIQICDIETNITKNVTQIKINKIALDKALKKEIVFFSDINNPHVTVNSLIKENIPEKRILRGPLYIKNNGNIDLYNLMIFLTGNLDKIVRMNLTRIDLLKKNEIVKQFLWINEDLNPKLDKYDGSIIIKAENFSVEFPVFLTIKREYILESNEEVNGLFVEDQSQEIDLESFEEMHITKKKKEPIKVKLPYKQIMIILLFTLLFLLYMMFKRPSKKRKVFSEFISKIEKK